MFYRYCCWLVLFALCSHAKGAEKPLYQCTEVEVGAFLAELHSAEPDLRKRIVRIARRNLGQPYELYLLGEAPFETYDPQPLYCLGKSDCVVFAEHTYAMALADSWPRFMALLQRIRYRDGQIGVLTRNHYTEVDWNISNRWLVTDITAEVAADKAVKFSQPIDRAAFFRNRYKIETKIPVQKWDDIYLPMDKLARADAALQPGDFVNVVRGVVLDPTKPPTGAFVGHVGLIGRAEDGTLTMIHSTEPQVREEPLAAYVARMKTDHAERDAARKPRLVGFKFLRLNADPLAELEKLDGPGAPKVTVPNGSKL